MNTTYTFCNGNVGKNDGFLTFCSTVGEGALNSYLNTTISSSLLNSGLYVNGKKVIVDKETKTKLFVNNGMIKIATFDNGNFKNLSDIIPDIIDVRVLNERVVIMTFADETEVKAVLDSQDKFSIETGVTICVMKKMFASHNYMDVGMAYIDSVYNKLVDYGVSKVNAEKNRLEAIKKRDNEIKKKKQKIREKKARKAKEKRINEMAEAISRSRVTSNSEK